MNTRRWLLASLAVFSTVAVLEFVIHGFVLGGLYQQTASAWRPLAEAEKLMWMFWIGYLVFAPFFTLLYVKGYESGKPGVGQGLRFGFYVGAMLSVMNSLGWYVVLPIPLVLAVCWFFTILVIFTVAGVVAGSVYRE